MTPAFLTEEHVSMCRKAARKANWILMDGMTFFSDIDSRVKVYESLNQITPEIREGMDSKEIFPLFEPESLAWVMETNHGLVWDGKEWVTA